MVVGVTGYGIYIPKYRIERSIIGKAWSGRSRGQNAVAGMDEDVITMAAEAALNAVTHADIDSTCDLETLYFGTSSALDFERSSLGVIGEVLRASDEIDYAEFSASPRASFAALKACQDAAASGRITNGLVIGAEQRATAAGSQEEMNCGDGAVAIMLGTNNVIAEIDAVYSYTTNFVDRWRDADSDFVKEYEPRFTRDYGYKQHIIAAAGGLFAKLQCGIDDFDHVVLQQPNASMVSGVAKALNANQDQLAHGGLINEVGDLGAASALMGLAGVLDKAEPGERILVLSYGSGASDAIALSVTDAIAAKRDKLKPVSLYLKSSLQVEDYVAFAKMTGALEKQNTPTQIGVPPTSSALWRDGREIRQLAAIKCKSCHYVNYPATIRKICVRCGGTEFDPITLARTGKVHTYCLSLYVPPPLVGPQALIIGDLDDGNRYRALGTEINSSDDVEIDMKVELVMRKIVTQDGVPVYGNVFRPIRIN